MGTRDQGNLWQRLGDGLTDFDRWLQTHDGHYELRRWINTGRSGSLVGVVARHENPDKPQQLIMRVGTGGPDEVRRLRNSWRHSPRSFRDAHLAELEDGPVDINHRLLVFQHIAGGDLTTNRALAEDIEDDEFAETCASITRSIVADWNPDFPYRPEPKTAAAYLRDLLGDRLKAGSELIESAARAGIDPGTEWIASSHGKRPLPNPLRLALDDSLAGPRQAMIVRGRAHGDLNVQNILLPADPASYQLVDLGEFDTAAPLARDPMHLLLSIVAKWIARVDPLLVGHDLAQAIVPTRNYQPPKKVGRFAKTSREMHGALQRWAADSGNGDLWAEQSLLSLIAAALRFAGRTIPETNPEAARRWFFYLAAVATSEFLDLWLDEAEPPANVFPLRQGMITTPRVRVVPDDDATTFLRALRDEVTMRAPDPDTELSMVSSTSMLRAILRHIPAPGPPLTDEIVAMAEDLRRELTAATRAGATYADREHVVKIHGWLRELLATPL
ncbi:hypothetical protein [Paractinoplanes atraurantiacus]|uniref:Phosphotransferase enzyme family protein n=1 Tax=Paractinoplanes atraurantiacus TaxID=1036182 RepID=A0A285GP97_9ACTN|nr:hypothetical protein [Actinoplanes atraurantiacus]SNY25367.1 hypothetical protein SAMN05421748_102325 [Actinoplanes atraurantiacus]